jgi:hypothetical protein
MKQVTEDAQVLRLTLQTLVATASWGQEFVHP